jgi:hypothetical protein
LTNYRAGSFFISVRPNVCSLEDLARCMQIGLDAQQVIAMRLARISAGGATAHAECQRMVAEKVSAAILAQAAAAASLARAKGGVAAAAAALAPVKRAVRANRRRLSRAKRIDGVSLNMRRLLRGGSY